RLQRLLPAGLQVQARLELEGAVLQLLHLEVEARDLQREVAEEVDGVRVEIRLAGQGRDHRRGGAAERLYPPQEPGRGPPGAAPPPRGCSGRSPRGRRGSSTARDGRGTRRAGRA